MHILIEIVSELWRLTKKYGLKILNVIILKMNEQEESIHLSTVTWKYIDNQTSELIQILYL